MGMMFICQKKEMIKMDKISMLKIMELFDVKQDSLEVGTASKGGGIKVYVNFSDLEETKTKIDNAIIAREYARKKIFGGKDE